MSLPNEDAGSIPKGGSKSQDEYQSYYYFINGAGQLTWQLTDKDTHECIQYTLEAIQMTVSEQKRQIWEQAFNIATEFLEDTDMYDKFLQRWSQAERRMEVDS